MGLWGGGSGFLLQNFTSLERDWLVEREAVKSISVPWILDGVIRGVGWISAFTGGGIEPLTPESNPVPKMSFWGKKKKKKRKRVGMG